MKKYLTFALLFTILLSNAQKASDVLKLVNKNYSDSQSLQFNTSYKLFKTAVAKQPYESYDGIFVKINQNEFYSKIGDTEIINSEKIGLRMVPLEKSILITDPVKFGLGDFDLQQLLNFCTINSFLENKTSWILTLNVKQFSSLPYFKIVIQIGKDYFIEKQQFYYNTGLNFAKEYNKEDINYPLLEINFSKYTRNITNKNIVNTEKFITVKSNKIISKLKNYQIIDERQKSIN